MRKALILIIALALFTSFAPDKELKWMAIGDSITFHNGKSQQPSKEKLYIYANHYIPHEKIIYCYPV